MKKLLIILLVALFSCNEEVKEPECSFPFNLERYEKHGFESICFVLNDTLTMEHYSLAFHYLKDSLAHCQPNQHVELCE